MSGGGSAESPKRNKKQVQHAKKPQLITTVEPPQLIVPKSKYEGYKHPLPVCVERTAIADLMDETKKRDGVDFQMENDGTSTPALSDEFRDFVEFELSAFSIYLPGDNLHNPFEMRGLQHLTTKVGHSNFFLDGILSVGNIRRYVQGVPFKVCSLGNYGEDIHTVGSNIWIQSNWNSKTDIYYRLQDPASEYSRYHDGFLWLADLAKHFVDYCQASEQPVSVHNFRADFSVWMKGLHDSSPAFQTWFQKYDHLDFRRAVAANIGFLYKETFGFNRELCSQPIFNELLELDAIPKHSIKERKTIVTPYVYDCFKEIRFGHHLESINFFNASAPQRSVQAEALHFTSDTSTSKLVWNSLPKPPKDHKLGLRNSPDLGSKRRRIDSIKAGDVLSVTKDGDGSVWKDEISRWRKSVDDCWYVFVQKVHLEDGERSFDALWLYKPADTSCAKMKYPFPNELFLSDNCTCTKARITENCE